MSNRNFRIYYILSVMGILLASSYPLYMGVKVVADMLNYGTVRSENYPKYIIPYTPISLALIVGVLLLPLTIRLIKRYAILVSSVISLAVFFVSELLLESKVIVTTTVKTTLESWQMYMCYVPPDNLKTRTWKAVDVLIGEYSPAFKIHFYLISILLILSILNCFYGFGQIIQSGNQRHLKPLVMQSVSSMLFLGLCILACFTAFFRTGELQVSALSAVLMCVFFVIMGVTAGIYVGSFLLGRNKWISIVIPAIVSALITLAMYIGEMILLNGHLYRFGMGWVFHGLGGFVLAPIDLLVIVSSGSICGVVLHRISRSSSE